MARGCAFVVVIPEGNLLLLCLAYAEAPEVPYKPQKQIPCGNDNKSRALYGLTVPCTASSSEMPFFSSRFPNDRSSSILAFW